MNTVCAEWRNWQLCAWPICVSVECRAVTHGHPMWFVHPASVSTGQLTALLRWATTSFMCGDAEERMREQPSAAALSSQQREGAWQRRLYRHSAAACADAVRRETARAAAAAAESQPRASQDTAVVCRRLHVTHTYPHQPPMPNPGRLLCLLGSALVEPNRQ